MAPKPVTKGLGPVLGMYSHGMVSPPGEIVVVAGQVGMGPDGAVVGPGDVRAQTKQAFENVRRVLEAAGCTLRDVVRLQTFLTHASDIDGFMEARRQVFPGYFPDGVYPPNTLVVVSRLVRPELLVEIEAMAVKSPRVVAAVRTNGKPRRRTAARVAPVRTSRGKVARRR